MPMIEVDQGGDRAVVFPLLPNDSEYKIVSARFNENGGVANAKIQQVIRIFRNNWFNCGVYTHLKNGFPCY